MKQDHNLSVSRDAFEGTSVEKGIHVDYMEKAEGKPPPAAQPKPVKPPTAKETSQEEHEATEHKRGESKKKDKEHSFEQLGDDEKKALRILAKVDGKSPKEKIEVVEEHFGVSKLHAINLLSMASHEASDGDPEDIEQEAKALLGDSEEEEVKKEDKDLKKAFEVLGLDSIEKGKNLIVVKTCWYDR